jgi:DNA-binding response OmpR family regulator
VSQPTNRLSPAQGIHILLLEEDENLRRSLHLKLRGHGFEVGSYSAAGLLLADARIMSAEILIADYQLQGTDGIRTLHALRDIGWRGHALLIAATPSIVLREAAAAAGYHAVLEKPLRPNELVRAITSLRAP